MLSRRVARFNRTVANHVVGPLLVRIPGFAMVVHQGRKTGREYRTPVKLFKTADGYVITLPYGSGADWVRNVRAAAGCELEIKGRRVAVVEPEVRTEATVPAFVRTVLGITEFLVLTSVEEQCRN